MPEICRVSLTAGAGTVDRGVARCRESGHRCGPHSGPERAERAGTLPSTKAMWDLKGGATCRIGSTPMLHAAVIGFPSTGKTTLFQLMTSIRDAPRGKGDVSVGISKVPDERLDRLTAMYNPRKRVPATVEFTDIIATARTGARRWSTSPDTRTPTRSYTSCARFVTRRSRIRPDRSIPARDAQAMEDELILADLGIAERRLERLDKDLKKARSAELEKERELVERCKVALEAGEPLRALPLTADDRKRLRGFQFLSAKPLLIVINVDEADIVRSAATSTPWPKRTGLTAFLARASTRAVALCAKIELEIAQLEAATSRGVSRRSRSRRNRDSIASSEPPTSCSATCRSSRSAKTNAAPGRSRAAHRRNSPPAKSTATFSAASSVRKSSPTMR